MPEVTVDFQEKIDAILIDNHNLKMQVEQYRQAYDMLQSQLKDLLRHRFGQRSERYIDPEHPQQPLFDTTEESLAQENDADPAIEVPAHKRAKKKKKEPYSHFHINYLQ